MSPATVAVNRAEILLATARTQDQMAQAMNMLSRARKARRAELAAG